MEQTDCPKCGTGRAIGALECGKCGIIFSKYQSSQEKLSRSGRAGGTHEVDYKVIGDDMQIVEIELDIGETVIAEAGAMNYMEDGITFEARMGDGSNPEGGVFDKLLGVGKRVLTGESIFMTHFTNSAPGKNKKK